MGAAAMSDDTGDGRQSFALCRQLAPEERFVVVLLEQSPVHVTVTPELSADDTRDVLRRLCGYSPERADQILEEAKGVFRRERLR